MNDSEDFEGVEDVERPRWLEDPPEPAQRKLRQALDEAPRFAPSEVRQRRVWARLADPRRSNRAVRRAFVLGALVASGLGVLVVASGVLVSVAPVSPAPVSAERPQARPGVVPPAVVPPAVVPLQAVPGEVGAAPSGLSELVRTGDGQHIKRALRQGAVADLQPNAVLALDGRGHPEVREGRVAFSVAHQPSGEHFRVRAGAFMVVVVGTRFLVKVQGADVGVSVDEGAVEIWGGGPSKNPGDRIARLVPGQSWSASTTGGTRSPARVPAEGPGSIPGLQGPQGPGASASGARSDLAEARAARADADPRRALAIYQRLADRGGPLAENALYETGGIYRDQLHQPRQALRAWEHYRARYPGGLLRAEADLSIVDTLSGLKESGRALKEALAFLKRYPRSERRGEIARVAGDLYRSRGHCREAADLYGRVDATNTSATDADDAAFGRAACLASLRDPAAASALQAYAHDRPTGRHRADVARLLGAAKTTDQP